MTDRQTQLSESKVQNIPNLCMCSVSIRFGLPMQVDSSRCPVHRRPK